MSEAPHDDPEAQPYAAETTTPPHTGVAEVDDMLRAVDARGEDVDTHVDVFESAHERLRGVLDRPPVHDEPA